MITRIPAPTPVPDIAPVPPEFPDLPDDVLVRFPSLRNWQTDDIGQWSTRLVQSLTSQNQSISQNVAQNKTKTDNLVVTFGQFRISITEEVNTIINEQEAQAQRIVTVSAMAGVNSNIKVQTTAPIGPALNDFWIDNSDLATPVTYQWSGVAWVEVTEPIAFAGVADERLARVTADGFLSAKYTLTVVAGDVITGFNITSASGPGANVSNVSWTADQFLIYSGTTKKQMFYADGVQDKVRLANLLTVDGALGAVYVKSTAGAGSFNSAGTTWYVDSSGGLARMSLGTKFVWDGTNLTIDGGITATTGTIGGWTISSTTLSKNNAVLDSAGQLVLGTANDVVYLSATDATYRIWIGNATAGAASFRVTKTGTMTAVNGVFSGAITSTSGTIGGFTLAATSLSAGAGTNAVALYSTPSGGNFIQLGDPAGAAMLLGNSFININGSDTNAHVIIGVSANSGSLFLVNSSNASVIEMFASTGIITATGFSGSGVSLTSLNASNISSGTLTNRLVLLPDGNAGAPGLAFNSDPDTGLWWSSSGTMNFATNGATRMVVRDSAVVLTVPLKLDNAEVATPLAPVGYINVQDSTGATKRLLTG